MYRKREETPWTIEWGFGHGSLWKKKKSQLFSKLKVGRNISGRYSPNTGYCSLYKCVIKRNEESGYFVQGWGNRISIWYIPQTICQTPFDSEIKLFRGTTNLNVPSPPPASSLCHSEWGWYLLLGWPKSSFG